VRENHVFGATVDPLRQNPAAERRYMLAQSLP